MPLYYFNINPFFIKQYRFLNLKGFEILFLVDMTDSRGWTALHEAVLGGSTEIVEYIVKLRPKMRFTG